MSKTYKKQRVGYYRSPRGHKKAKLNNLRNVPPSSWEDMKPDNQCFIIDDIIKKLFNKGMTIEEIEKKVRPEYKIKHWKWKEIINHYFDKTLKIQFDGMVSLSDEKTHAISVSKPNSEPYVIIKTNLPIENYLIISTNMLMRWQTEIIIDDGIWGQKIEQTNKIYPFPNPKLEEILMFTKNHYIDNGMIFKYKIRKWQMGFDECEIEYY